MSKHTPGPWAVVVDEHGSPDIYPENWKGEKNLPAPGYALIARVSPWDGEPEKVPEATANAVLIAASPELLGQHEADMVDLELLAKAIHAGDPMPELVIRVTDMLNRKRAVIARATQP